MSGDHYPKFRAASVQASSVFLDRDATIDKVESLVKKAAQNGADIVVFPESFIPAFPVWNMLYAPMDQHHYYQKLFNHSITIPSPQFKQLSHIAKTNHIYLSIGISEKSDISMGAMWNTNLLFNRQGELLNRHRKLVPTWAEKLSWANGDASQLEPVQTELGRIGVLICGENTNTLARYALLAQGEQVHISSYPPLWPFQRPQEGNSYNIAEAIKLRAAAHSFEGKVFNIVSSGLLDEDAIQQLSQGDSTLDSLLREAPQPASFVVGPTGEMLDEPLLGKEGIVEAEIDVSESIILKQAQDIVGYYNRFDIFQLKVNKRPQVPVVFDEQKSHTLHSAHNIGSTLYQQEQSGEHQGEHRCEVMETEGSEFHRNS